MSAFLAKQYPFLVVLATVLWKRRATKGGSTFGREMKDQALKVKKRRRQRLRSFLADDVLRAHMLKQLEEVHGEGAQRQMEELEMTARRDVTAEDVHVSTSHVAAAAMRRICLVYALLGWVLNVFFVQPGVLLSLTSALLLHMVDSRLGVGTSNIAQGMWLVVFIGIQLAVGQVDLDDFGYSARGTLLLLFSATVGLVAGFGIDEKDSKRTKKTSQEHSSLSMVI